MFKVRLEGLNGLKAEINSLIKETPEIIESEMQAMAQEFVAGAKRDAPKDQATLVQGISWYNDGGNRMVITSNAFYSPFMEFGTKGKYRPIPGTEGIASQFKGYKGGDFMELLRNIVRWVKRKGISGTYSVKTQKRTGNKINRLAEDYSVAWPIAISILKKGVNPHPFFFKQMETTWPEMVKRIQSRLAQRSKVSVIMPGEIQRPKIVTI